MNDNAKVFSLIEMREMMIDTSDYQMMEKRRDTRNPSAFFSPSTTEEKSSHRFSGGRLTSDFTICRSVRSSDFFIRKVIKTKFTLRRSKSLKMCSVATRHYTGR